MKKRKFKKTYRVIKKKPLLENNIISSIIIAFCLFCFFVYFIIFYPKFQLEDIVIENDKYINQEAFTQFIANEANNKILYLSSNSMFLINKTELRKEILLKMPIIQDVKITKTFPNTLNFEIKERVPASIWCQKKEKSTCYYIDKAGVAFQKAEFMGKNFFIIIKDKEDLIIGDEVITKEDIEKITLIENTIKDFNFEVDYFKFHSKERFEVILVDGWSFLFTYENIEEELENLPVAYNQVDEKRRKELEYIDLRFKDRLFYK